MQINAKNRFETLLPYYKQMDDFHEVDKETDDELKCAIAVFKEKIRIKFLKFVKND